MQCSAKLKDTVLDPINWKSTNLVYGFECSFCELIYFETKIQPNSRINGLRLKVNNGGNQLFSIYPTFLSFRWDSEILKKTTIQPTIKNLITPLRREREVNYNRDSGTTMPFDCNDRIHSSCNLSSDACSLYASDGIIQPPTWETENVWQ